MPRIKAINIYAFRGIPDLELNFDGKNLILRGENATGKSSIVEAFEFFFTGKLSMFEGEGTQSLSLSKHAPHKNFTKEDVSIKVTFDPGNITLERTFEVNPDPPAPLKRYFEAAQRGTFILRRSQVLKFIASIPAERFRAIASIIGIERLDNVELAMKRAYEELEGNVTNKRNRMDSIFSTISGYLGGNVTSIKQALDLVNKKIEEVNLAQLTSFDEISKLSEQFLKSFKESSNLEQIMKLNEIIEQLGRFSIDEEIISYLIDLNLELKPFFEEKIKRELFLRDFLTKGQQAVEKDERNICPLCGQEIDKQTLLKQIKSRLQTLSELSTEATEVRRLVSDIEDKLSSLEEDIGEICKHLETLEQLSKARVKLEKMQTTLEKFKNKLRLAKELKIEEEMPINEFRQNLMEIQKLIKSSHIKCKNIFKKIGVPSDWKKKMDVITLSNRISALVTELNEVERALIADEKQLSMAKIIYEKFSETKKAKIGEIYESIKGNVNIFYSTLHPNDPHKNIEISVVPARRASTELKIESFGSIEDPRAFTSEGHLDSLGLCIFLAFVKRFNEDCNFVILDDVVTTIDSQHRGLICKLLFEHFKDYQLFITTHDAIWYEQLCAAQHAYGVSGNCKNLEIVKWTLETGPIIEPYKPRWERLESKISSGDKSGAANEGRRYLEWLLKNICETMQARPVFKTTGYTVADLFIPARARIMELAKDSQFKQQIIKCFQELEATTLMGNLLSHDNLEAENVSMNEVKRFCLAVHELHNALKCNSCGTFLKYYQDIRRIRCPNSQCTQPTEIVC
jgi:recombinational DNA repair ATPase RecF